jgi:hypothetical protein
MKSSLYVWTNLLHRQCLRLSVSDLPITYAHRGPAVFCMLNGRNSAPVSLTREAICIAYQISWLIEIGASYTGSSRLALPSLFELDDESGAAHSQDHHDVPSLVTGTPTQHAPTATLPLSWKLPETRSLEFWLAARPACNQLLLALGRYRRHVCKQQSPKQRRQQPVSQPRSATSSFPDIITCWRGAGEWQRSRQRKLPAAFASGTSARPKLPL